MLTSMTIQLWFNVHRTCFWIMGVLHLAHELYCGACLCACKGTRGDSIPTQSIVFPVLHDSVLDYL